MENVSKSTRKAPSVSALPTSGMNMDARSVTRSVNAAVSRRLVLMHGIGIGYLLTHPLALAAEQQPTVNPQPYFAQIKRIISVLRKAGAPLELEHESRLLSLAQISTAEAVEEAE